MNNSTSIVIPGQIATMVPVKLPTAPGASGCVRSPMKRWRRHGDYSWTSMKPGTYLYHSGTHPQVQVQMGLYGGVKKDFAAGQIYPGVAYSNR